MSLDLRPPITSALVAFGVDVTVTVSGEDPVETTGLWLAPDTVLVPTPGGEYKRAEQQRVMALAKSAIPALPRGSVVSAPETKGAAAQTWRVDAADRDDYDHWRMILLPVTP